MNIVFFMPARNIEVTRLFHLVFPLLPKHYQIHIIDTTWTIKAHLPPFSAPVVHWSSPIATQLIQDAHCRVYHIDNQYELYMGCLAWLPRFPGLVCLHHGTLKRFSQVFSRLHAKEAKQIGPLLDWICAQATAVLAVGKVNEQQILAHCPGPLKVLEKKTEPEQYVEQIISLSSFIVQNEALIQASDFFSKQLQAWGTSLSNEELSSLDIFV